MNFECKPNYNKFTLQTTIEAYDNLATMCSSVLAATAIAGLSCKLWLGYRMPKLYIIGCVI